MRRSWCTSSTGCTKQFGAQEWLRKAPTLRLRKPQATNVVATSLRAGGEGGGSRKEQE